MIFNCWWGKIISSVMESYLKVQFFYTAKTRLSLNFRTCSSACDDLRCSGRSCHCQLLRHCSFPKPVMLRDSWDSRQSNISQILKCHVFRETILTPKERRPFFGPFLDIEQAIVDVIFVQKISNFWWTCGVVLASRRTNFYKIPIFGYTVMPQKHFFFVKRVASSNQKTF
jgi:hypothetical protein